MNKLKKTLALVAALSMTVTAFASCGDDPSSSTPSSSSKAESSEAESSDAESSGEESKEESSQAPQESTGEVDASVGQGGDTLTIAAWNADDVPYLIAQWKGIDLSLIHI